ncbi:hypothetical protein ACFPK9_15145 [Rubritalea spongiae]
MITLLPFAAVTGLFLTSCEVEKTEEGKLPEVDVDVKTEEGKLPEYDVETADVEVKEKKVEVTVPDVDVKMPDEQKEEENE